MKRVLFKLYTPIILIGFIAVLVWVFKSPKGKDEISIFVTIVGGLISLFYFIQKQQLEELQLFKELFTEFNNRYDKLNDDLNHLVEKDSSPELNEQAHKLLNDYFNLCAEEFLFYRKGYIYPEVWKAWRNGMLHFLNKDHRIKAKWVKETESDSYYGLEAHIRKFVGV